MKNATRGKPVGKRFKPTGQMPNNTVSKHAKARQQRQTAKNRRASTNGR